MSITTVPPADRAVYTVAEVAALLSLSRGSAYALVRAGEIPAVRLGGRWVIPRRRFHAWLDQAVDDLSNPTTPVRPPAGTDHAAP